MSQVIKCDICGKTNDDCKAYKEIQTFRITVKRRWWRGAEFEEIDVCPDCLRAIRKRGKEQ